MSILKLLERIDKTLFVAIHHDADASLLDSCMLLVRHPLTWIPVYAWLLYYSIRKAGIRAWKFILLSLLTFTITDTVSASVLKPFFGRLRPCHDAELQPFLRNIIDCGGLYSFPSSHASNHFGLAVFWYWSLWLMTGKKWTILWVWAALVGYAQVYVGKHYPLDIAGGAALGIITGTLTVKLFAYSWSAGFEPGRLQSEV